MWLYATWGIWPPIFLYEYQPSRPGRHPKTFLGFKGYPNRWIPGYNDIKDVTIADAGPAERIYRCIKSSTQRCKTTKAIACEGRILQ